MNKINKLIDKLVEVALKKNHLVSGGWTCPGNNYDDDQCICGVLDETKKIHELAALIKKELKNG